MLQPIAYCLAAVLMVLGMIYIGGRVSDWIHRPKILPGMTVIIPFSGSVDNIEQILRYIYNNIRWNGCPKGSIILLDRGMSISTRYRCDLFCRDNPAFVICRV